MNKPFDWKNTSRLLGDTPDHSQFFDDLNSSSSLLALEQRIVFDAAAVATGTEVLAEATDPGSQSTTEPTDAAVEDLDAALSGVEASSSNEIVFIDAAVGGVQQFLESVPATAEVVLLEADRDGVEQIAQVLQDRTDLDAIHILSHGEQGKLFIGDDVLDAESMQGEHLDELTVIRNALSDTGDILIYGCDFTGGESGLEAAMLLGSITGADVAASSDLTGATALGGDWELETHIGSVETDELSAGNWDGLLIQRHDTTGLTQSLDFGTQGWTSNSYNETFTDVSGSGTNVQVNLTDTSALTSSAYESGSGFTGGEDGVLFMTTGFGSGSTTIEYNFTGTGVEEVGFDLFHINTNGSAGDMVTVRAVTNLGTVLNNPTITTAGANSTYSVSGNTLDATGTSTTASDMQAGFNFTAPGGETITRIEIVWQDYSGSTGGTHGLVIGNIDFDIVNVAPDAVDDNFVTAPDTAVSGSVATNDSDLNGDALSYSLGAGPSNGALSLNSDGSFTYTPNAGFIGTDTFTYIVDDGNGGTSTATATIVVDTITSGWSITGDTSVTEGAVAGYIVSLTETIPAGQTASVDLSLIDIDTSSADYDDFIAAVNTAVASRSDLTFDGTTLTYTAPSGGYTSSYNATGSTFVDISGTGTAMNIGDDASVLTNIGFGFDFYGTSYSQLYVSDNGYVTFGGPYGGGTTYINQDMSSGTAMGGLPGIAAYWDDLDPSAAGAIDVFAQTTGTPGNQQFIIQWNNLPIWGAAGADTGTFQLIFDEATGELRVNYPDVDFDGSGNDFGASATIAVQDGAGQATQHSFNSPGSVASGSSIVFAPVTGTMADLAISLGTVDDTTAEGAENYRIALSNTVNSALMAASSVDTTIVDNDVAAPVVDLDTTDPAPAAPSAFDDFESGTLTGGTGAWTSDWTFVDLGGGGTSSDVGVETKAGSQALFVQDDGVAVQRTVDLTNAETATLSFDYLRDGLDNSSDFIVLEVSTDGVNFTAIDTTTFVGPVSDGSFVTNYTADLTPYISSNTTIRFATSSSLGGSDKLYIDNLSITTTAVDPTSHSATYLTNSAPIPIASADTGITDADSPNMTSATITLTNPQTGDALSLLGSMPAGITATVNGTGDAVTLTGTASSADYAAAIELIGFATSGTVLIDRVIEVQVTDDDGIPSNIAISTISVEIDSDADGVSDINDIDDDNDGILDINEQALGFTTATTTLTYDAAASAAATQVNGQPVIILTDGDITVTITNNSGATISGSSVSTDSSSGTAESVRITITSASGTVYLDSIQFGDLDDFDQNQFVDAIALDQTGTWSNLGNANGTDAMVAYTNDAAGEAAATADTGETASFSTFQAAGAVSDILLNPASSVHDNYFATFNFDSLVDTFLLFGSDVVSPLDQVTYINFDTLVITYAFETMQDVDTDGDGVVDRLDIDSDNDGITGNVEAQTTAGYIAPSGTGAAMVDIDGDGLDDNYDADTTDTSSAASLGLTPVDTDGDGTADYLDTDSDNDGLTDTQEAGHGVSQATIDASADTDGDGLKDVVEGADANDGFDVNDENLDATDSSFLLADSDDDTNADGSNAVPTVTDLDYRDDQFRPIIDLNDDGTTLDRTWSDTFTEGDVPVSVTDTDADIIDGDDTSFPTLDLVLGGFTDTGSEIVTIGGTGFTYGTALFTTVTVGGTTFDVDYDGAESISFNRTGGGEMPEADIEALIRSITYEHTSEDPTAGDRTFSFVTSDGDANSNTAVSTITVVPVNDAPVATDNTNSVVEGATVSGNMITDDSGAGTDSDPEGDTLAVTEVNGATFTPGVPVVLASGAEVTLQADGSYTYNTNGQFDSLAVGATTTDSFTYTIDDGNGGTDTATVTITITGVNDAPLAADDVNTTDEDTTLTVNAASGLLANDNDVDGDTLTITDFTVDGTTYTPGAIVSLAEGDLTINADGSYTFVPAADYNGPVPVATYTVDDGNGGTDTATLTLTVTSVNDAPVANDDVVPVTEDIAVSGNVLTNDTDADGDTLTVIAASVDIDGDGTDDALAIGAPTLLSNAAGDPIGTITLNADGSFTFTPAPNYFGAVPSITYTASDGNGGTADADAELILGVITAVNDTPIIDLNSNATPGNADRDYAATFTEGDSPVGVTDTDADVKDFNEDDVDTMTIVVSGATDGASEELTIAGTTFDLSASTSFTVLFSGESLDVDYNAATGTITITESGGAAIDDPVWDALLPTIQYEHTSQAPTAGDRVFEFSVADQFGSISPFAYSTITVVPVNDAPVANDDTESGPEDALLSGNVVANDIDVDGDTLTVTEFIIGGTTYAPGTTVSLAEGDLTLNADGSFTFDPAADFNGAVPQVTYTITDGSITDTATLDITITPVNDAPVATDDANSTAEDTTLTVAAASGLLANDTDIDGDTLSVTDFTVGGSSYAAGATASLAEGDLTINADGSYTFVPATDYNGPVPVATYTVDDGNGGTDTATLTIAVTPVNDAPVATDDSNSTAEDTTLTVDAASGLLANDTDIDGDTLSVTGFTVGGSSYAAGATASLAEGDLTINADGSYTFVPAADYNGPVPVATYTVDDGNGGTDTATLTIAVTPVNDAPVAVDDSNSTAEDTTLTVAAASGLLANDSDVDGDTLSVTDFTVGGSSYAAGATASLAEGDLTINADGSYTFVPATDYNGPVPAATYTVDDGNGGTDTATLTIAVTPVNDAPVATDDANSTAEDTTLTVAAASGLLANDTDIDGDTLSVTDFTVGGSSYAAGATASLAEGDLTINADGSYTFVPATDYNGPVPVATYTVDDGNGGTDTATLTIAVTPVNDAPVATDDANSTAEDTTLTVDAASGLLANDTDIDGDTLSITGFTVDGSSYAAGATASLAEGDLTINADGSYSFVPATDYNGPVPVATYTVDDGNGGTDTATLTIAVTPVNDAPVATDDANSTAEDTTLTVDAASGLLANDSDVDGDILSVTDFTVGGSSYAAGATASLAEGDLTINADGSYTFVPAPSYNGPVPVATYTVDDGNGGTDTATLALTVGAVNDAPVAVDDANSTAEDTTLTVDAASGLLSNDSDVDGDTLSVTGFTVDGSSYAAGATASLAEGNLTINADGSYTFVPAADYNGPVPVATYTVDDGNGGTDTATLTIAVTPVNDAPVATDDANSTAEDTTLTVAAASGLLANDTDIDGDTLSVTDFTVGGSSYAAGATASLAEGDLTINADGSYTFVPATDYNGPVPVATYTVDDGNGGTDTATLTIAVTPVNDAPVAADDSNSTVEDTTLTVDAASGLLSNDSDVDGDTLSVTGFTVGGSSYAAGATASLAEGDLTINADGSYTFVPATDYNGPVPVATYTVDDGNGGTDTATLTIAVTPVNDAPVAADDSNSTVEDTTLTVDAASGLLSNDSDVDGDTLSVTGFTVGGSSYAAGATASLAEGDLTINADGSYTFVPATDYNGPVPVATYTVDDGNGGTDTATLTIAVTPVNDAPVATDDSNSTAEDTTLTVDAASGLLANDSDVDGDTLSVTDFTVGGSSYAAGATASLAEGDLTINADGSYTFVPAADYNGPVPVATYTVDDGNGGTDTATLTIAVTPVNDAPVATDDANSTAEDTTLTVAAASGLLANDTDIDGDTLSVTDFTVGGSSYAAGATASLAEGDLTINADGSYTFVPATDYNGPVPVATYTVDDGNGGTDTATLTIAVTPVNDAPVATDDANSTAEDTTLTVDAASGLLANDTDIDGDTLSITGFTVDGSSYAAGATASLAEGDLTINADGSYSFVPATDYNGPVPVATYTVDDGNGGTDTATLTIAVTPVNDAPVATDDSNSTAEDTTLTVDAASGLLANDTDIDGDTLSVTGFTVGGSSYAAGATASLAEGDLTINADGSYTFVPATDYNGPVPVATYTVDDGNGGTDTATLTIAVTPVNDAPVATDDSNSTAEDTTLTVDAASGLLANDSDVDGDTLSVTGFTVDGSSYAAGATASLAEGNLTINADGSYTFVPATDYNGPVPVATYTVDDGNGGTDTATLTIAVTPVNDAPVATDDANSTAEDTTLTVAAASGLLANDTDIDGDTLSVTDFTVGGSSYAAGATASLAEGDLTINADGSYTFVPAADYNGPVPVATYTVDDGNGGTDTATLTIAVTPVNDAPVATDDANSTAEDTTLTVDAASGLLANDSDVDGDILSVTGFTVDGSSYAAGATASLAEGDLTINADGSYSFVPAMDYNGPVPVATYTVDDGNGGTDTATLTIAVTPVNDAPVATDDANSTAEDTTLTVDAASGLLANDSDVDGDILSVTDFTVGGSSYAAGATASLAEGDLTINADGSYTFVPAPSYNGPVPVATYTVDDGNGGTDTATLALTVGAVNDAPVAVDDANSTAEDTTLTVDAASGLLSNDSDVDGDTLSVTGFTVDGSSYAAGATASLAEGNLTINADGSYTFVPAADYNGPVPVATYTVDDGNGGTDTATLTIAVTPVNDAPVATDDANSTAEDTTLTVAAASGLLANDTDIDGDTLSVTDFTVGGSSYAAGATASLAEGDLTINADGSYTFVPATDYNGPVPVATYTVDDGNGGTDTATLTIAVTPVNDAPVAADDSNSTVEDTTLTVDAASGLLSNDSDVDGDTLSVTGFTVGGSSYAAGATASLAEGDLTINADGSYTFVPATDYNGPVPVATYTVDDGNGGTDTATLTIAVTPVNDAPVAADDSNSTVEDTTLTVDAASGLLSNDSDVDGDTLSVTGFTVGGSSYAAGATASLAEGDLTINADGSYTFVPATDYNGPVPVATYTVDDGNGGTDTATLTIAVTPVNDAPVATDDSNSTAEDTTLTVDAASGLLANDSDVDGDTLSVTDFTVGGSSYAAGATASLAEGDLTINADGSYTFVPAADYNGPVPVATYTVDDGNGGTDTATLTIAVTPVNDAPVATDDANSTAEDTTLTVAAASGLLANDTDIDGDTLSVTDFTVGGSSYAAGATASLAEGDLTINADGSYTFVPATDYNGPVPVATYTVDDGNGGTDTATLTIAVTPVNDAPVATDDANSTAEDTTLTVAAASGLLANDTDIDGDTLSITGFTVDGSSYAAGATASLAEGDLTINADGSYSFVPATDYNGPVPVATYTVDDGNGGTDTATLTIAVTPVNDAPVATDDSNSTAEDTTLTVDAASGLLANDTDIDGDTLSVTDFTVGGSSYAAGATASLAEGDLTINADGSYTFVPATDYNGPVPVATYTVDDGNGGTDTATLTIAVTPVNDAPVATDDANSTAEDTTLTVDAASGLLANDTDIDGDTLSITGFTVDGSSYAAGATASLAEGDLTINADGSYSFVPATDYNGPVPVATYTVDDGNGGTDTATLTIAVTPVNDAPVAADDSNSTAEDTTLTVDAASGLLANDSDVDGDTLSVTGFTVGGSSYAAGATASLAEGDLTINADGSYTFVPATDYNGPVPVATYTVDDGNGGTDTATLTIAVTPVNDAPVATDDSNSTAEDTTLTVAAASGLLANDSDIDGDTLSVTGFTVDGSSYAAGATASLAEGDLTINADGSYTFVPAPSYNGPVPVATYTVDDGNGGTDTATLALTVGAVNDAPVATDDSNSTAEDTTLTVAAASGLLANDTDIDGDTLSVTDFTVGGSSYAAGATASLAEGDLTINADGSYTFVPAADYNGPVPVATYTVDDGNGGTDTATLTIAVTPVNDAPVAVDDSNSTAEDTTLTVAAASGLLANDSDVDGDTLSVTGFTVDGSSYAAGATASLAEGDLTINADGSYTFVPATDYNGPVPAATYTVDDGNGGTDTATLTIAVTPVNDAPVATDDANSTAEDTTLTVAAASGLLANDTDIDGDTLSVTDFTVGGSSYAAGATASLAEGDLTINADGSYTFVPATDYNGPVPVATYTVDDGNGGTDTATLTIAVTPVNDAPVATDDANSTAEDTTLTVDAASGLLANDTDIDGDTLSITGFTVDGSSYAAGATASLAEGDLTINADGSYSFVPATDYNGPVPVATYTVDDGNGGTDTATLTIAVTPVNDAPVAADDSNSTAEDTTLTVDAASGLLANDTDIDGDTLSVTGFTVGGSSYAAGATASLAEGDLTINADGSYSFVPATDYNGPVPVATYTVDDGNGGTDTATLTIAVTPVNDAPVAADDSNSTAEDTTLTVDAASGLLANDSDVDGDTLSITGFTVDGSSYAAGATASLAEGDLTINADGSYSFVPATDYNGPVPVATYTVDDGNGGTDTATLTIAVTPVNDAPVATDDANSTAEDTTLTVDAASGLLANDTDIDGDTLSITGFTVDGSSYAAGATASLAEGDLTINADGSYSFVPATDYNGPVPVATYTVDDGNGGTDTATLTIAVTPVNDAPVATDDSNSTAEDTTLTVDAASGLLANDTDIDGDTLSVTDFTVGGSSYAAGATASLAEGDLTINADGSYSFVPATDYNGPVPAATYTVDDGNGGTDTATLTIAVTPVNDAPVATDDANSTAEDTTLTVDAASGLLANDTDIDGDTLSITGFTVDGSSYAAGATASLAEGDLTINADGSYSFVPATDYNGPVPAATYTVDDGNGGTDTATLTIAVTVVNNAPVATDDAQTTTEDTSVSGTVTSTDVDGDPLITTLDSGPSNGSAIVNPDGTYSYTPEPDFIGTDSFTVLVDDGNGGTDIATVTITVTPVNDAPVATDDARTTPEDTPVSGVVTSTDVDGDALTASLDSGPSNGSVTVNPDGTYSYTPDPDFTGTDSFTVLIDDGNGGTDTATVTITVTPVNDAPVATGDARTTPEDTPVSGAVTSTDVDGGSPVFSLRNGPSNGSVTVNPDGTYSYTPEPDFTGTDTFTVLVDDGNGGTDIATVTITVTPVNDAPVAQDDAKTTPEDTPVSGAVTSTDVDGDTLIATLDSGPSNGSVTVNPDGTYSYTPDPDFTGTDSFTVLVDDGNGGTDIATVTITVTPVNDAPVATGDARTTPEDTPVNGVVTSTDVDGGSPVFSLRNSPSNGSVTVNPDGTYSYTPEPDFTGTDTFTVLVDDGNGGTDTATVTITVTPVNDAPVATGDARTTPEDTPVSGAVTSTDVDGGSPVFSLRNGPSNGSVTVNPDGTYSYTPEPDFTGTDTFTVLVDDGNGGTDIATVTITVTPVNDAPVAQDDAKTTPEDTPVSGAVTSTDVDGGSPVFSLRNSPSNGSVTVNPDGTYSYTPEPDFTGTDTFTVLVDDGNGGTDIARVTITVTPVNDAPVAQDDLFTVGENESGSGSVAGNDFDVDGDSLAFALESAPAMGTLVFNADGTITYTPNLDYTGVDTFTYSIADPSGLTSLASVQIDVVPSGAAFVETMLGRDDPVDPVRDAAIVGATITADGVIVDTVNQVNSLNSVGTIGADGVIVETANAIENLDGTGSIGETIDGVLTALSEDRVREVLESFQLLYGQQFEALEPEGLSGFSLRQTVAADTLNDGSIRQGNVVIDTLVREDQLYVQVSGHTDTAGSEIVEFRFKRDDGRPLPDWLRATRGGLLIGHRPVNVDEVTVSVTAVFNDGTAQTTTVLIQARSGEIQLVEKMAAMDVEHRGFAGQLSDSEISQTQEIDALADALKTGYR